MDSTTDKSIAIITVISNFIIYILINFTYINQPLLKMANKKYMTRKTNRVYNGIAHVSTVKHFQ